MSRAAACRLAASCDTLQTQTAAGAANGPGTILGTVELNVTNVNPDYTLDFGSGSTFQNLVSRHLRLAHHAFGRRIDQLQHNTGVHAAAPAESPPPPPAPKPLP